MKYLLLTLIIFLFQIAVAQSDSTLSKDEIISILIENSADENDETDLYDFYENLYEEKLNINTITFSELSQFPFLTIDDISEIIEFRNSFQNIDNLQLLYKTAINKQKLILLLPFLRTKSVSTQNKQPFSVNDFEAEWRSRTQFQKENIKGIDEEIFFGNKFKTYSRLKSNYLNKYYFNFLIEKDAGEKSYNDFLTYNFSYKNDGFIENIIFGSYLVRFGQGLLFWSPYSTSKSSNSLNVSRNSSQFSAYTSSEENKYLNGIATTIHLNNFNFSAFYSNKYFDATIEDNSFHSIISTGLHRTENEINKVNKLRIIHLGGIVNYKNSFLNTSFILFKQTQSEDLINPSANNLIGKETISSSHSLAVKFKKMIINSEISYSSNALAYLISAKFQIHKNFSFVSLFRNYPAEYIALFSNGFGEYNNTNNELGFYNALQLSTFLGKFNFYYDFFSTQNLPKSSEFSETGNDALIDFLSKRFYKTQLNIKYKIESKQKAEELNQEITKITTEEIVQKYRIKLNISPNKFLELKTQFDCSIFKNYENRETGYSIFQQINFSPFVDFKSYLRLTYFDTPSFSSRIYLYENDLDGVFSNRLFYGNGIAWFILIKYQLVKHFNLNLKYSQIFKPNEQYLSSGITEIEGNTDSRIHLQIEIQL